MNANKRVKVDVSKSKQLELDPEMQGTFLGYSVQAEHKLLCYSLEEILVEKLRAMMQVMQSKDFYDFWHL
ncbi:MAG: hypothetical protein EA409_09025 [Saprospirales bacterium]|nr:MAG: hypothetical protein EA409_09025 [Saprospirales bacterium]